MNLNSRVQSSFRNQDIIFKILMLNGNDHNNKQLRLGHNVVYPAVCAAVQYCYYGFPDAVRLQYFSLLQLMLVCMDDFAKCTNWGCHKSKANDIDSIINLTKYLNNEIHIYSEPSDYCCHLCYRCHQ